MHVAFADVYGVVDAKDFGAGVLSRSTHFAFCFRRLCVGTEKMKVFVCPKDLQLQKFQGQLPLSHVSRDYLRYSRCVRFSI